MQTEEHDRALGDLKKKHGATIGDLEEQVEGLQKIKSKLEKERHALTSEAGDLSSQLDGLQKAKVRRERGRGGLERTIGEGEGKGCSTTRGWEGEFELESGCHSYICRLYRELSPPACLLVPPPEHHR